MSWQFSMTAADSEPWHWLRIDDDTGSVLAQSHGTFATLYECGEDAKLHGYVAAPTVRIAGQVPSPGT
jgi:hypothetical protein